MTISNPDAVAGAPIARRAKRMTGIVITRHGEARLSQRGIRKSDLDILLTYGTETGPDRIMLRKYDAAQAIRDFKRQIAVLARLSGKEIVIADGQLITAYHRTRPHRPSGRKAGRGR